DQGQPLLGLRLQHGGDPAGRPRPAQPGHRRRRDGRLQRLRGRQQPATADLPQPVVGALAMAAGEHAVHADHGGDGHGGHGDHVARFRRRCWVALALAAPTVALNEMFAGLIGYSLPEGGWVAWVSPALGTVIYLWGGRPFLSGARAEIGDRRPGMMVLIAL